MGPGFGPNGGMIMINGKRRIMAGVMALALATGLATPGFAGSWTEVKTPHFTVYYDSSPTVAKTLSLKLEAFARFIPKLFVAERDEGTMAPYNVILINDEDTLSVVEKDLRIGAASLNDGCEEGNNNFLKPIYVDAASETGSHIKHGVPDYFLSPIFSGYATRLTWSQSDAAIPDWYLIGFMLYLQNAQFNGDLISVGIPPYGADYQLNSGKWLDFADVLRRRNGGDAKDVELYAAQSWLLTHYIMTDTGRRRLMPDYVLALKAGEDPVAAFERVFGIPVADLKDRLSTYYHGNVPLLSLKMDVKDSDIALTTPPKSYDRLLLWKSALETCRGSREVLNNVRRAASQYPDDMWAQTVRARAEVVIGDAATADHLLDKVLAADPKNAEAVYLKGRVYLARASAGKSTANDMVQARRAFTDAYHLDPTLAPDLYFLSQTGDTQTPDATTVAAALQAANLSPMVARYAFNAARMLILTGRANDALPLLNPIAYGIGYGEGAAAPARQLITAIKAGKPQAELLLLTKLPA